MTLVIAHRGASATERENTLPAFRAARGLGADGVEMDVRLTADGALVVHHDPHVPGLGLLSSLRSADLPDWVPSLEAAVEACEGMQLNLELKNLPTEPGFDPTEALSGAICRFLGDHGLDEQVWVSSFSLASLEVVRSEAPWVRTGWLVLGAYDEVWALGIAARDGHWAVEPVQEVVTADLVAAAHQAGLAVVAWTVDDPLRIRSLAEMEVDAVVTNVPDVARSVLVTKPSSTG